MGFIALGKIVFYSLSLKIINRVGCCPVSSQNRITIGYFFCVVKKRSIQIWVNKFDYFFLFVKTAFLAWIININIALVSFLEQKCNCPEYISLADRTNLVDGVGALRPRRAKGRRARLFAGKARRLFAAADAASDQTVPASGQSRGSRAVHRLRRVVASHS